ncbi:MAG: hypothetical protein ABIN97_19410 [Ginsengibacter sp.]
MMKSNKNELNVDFIGGAGPLTKEEEKTISEFIKASKERNRKQKARKTRRSTIIYKSKTSKSSFPQKTEEVNKPLSKAKLLE